MRHKVVSKYLKELSGYWQIWKPEISVQVMIGGHIPGSCQLSDLVRSHGLIYVKPLNLRMEYSCFEPPSWCYTNPKKLTQQPYRVTPGL